MELNEYLQQVTDQQSFLAFVYALKEDKKDEEKQEEQIPSSPYNPGWNGWENSTITDFLEAAIAWAEALNFGDNTINSSNNLWQKFALFLYAGKFYE